MPINFPSIEGKTADSCWDTLLEVMSVPGYAGVYVLGCFARYVTIYSQQVRALNLIDALCKAGHLSRRSEIAIIGAGIAGLTAAAGAAVRGVKVRVFEMEDAPSKAQGLMPLQRNSRQRMVHPHIYDWPIASQLQDGDKLPSKAGFSIMDWEADIASDVVRDLEKKFEEIRQATGDRIHLEANPVRGLRIEPHEQPPVLVYWDGHEERAVFTAVILAVGFGREKGMGSSLSYWTDDGLDGVEAKHGKWLVSGYGDGALTDLMRLCTADFKHSTVLSEFIKAVPEHVKTELLDAERKGHNLSEAYRKAAGKMSPDLSLRGTSVDLNCTETQLFSPRSSILNRLIAAYLLNKGAFTLLEKDSGKIKTPPKRDAGKFVVEFEERGVSRHYDGVVIRHGPISALREHFEPIWKACADIREAWQALPQGSDWTRVPRWNDKDFSFDPSSDRLRVDFGDKVGCVVLVPDEEESGSALRNLMRAALVRVRDHDKFETRYRQSLDVEPVVIKISDALSTPADYARTVRALCSCHIAVFDLTGFGVGSALFLGIRSVARRSVTIVTTRDKHDEDAWKGLPFNIKELSPIARGVKGEDFTERLRETILEGFSMSGVLQDDYLDLPAYSAVRQLGTQPTHYRPIPPDERVLILSSFDKGYLENAGEAVQITLNSIVGSDRAVRIIDTNSPQLASQKLYAAIRRTSMCVVDWTDWRYNVFFELGIRLAVNEHDPICLVQNITSYNGPQQQALKDLFKPYVYSTDRLGELENELRQRHEAITRFRATTVQVGNLSPGYTFRLVRDSIDPKQEPGGTPVARQLRASASLMIGPDLRRYGTLPILYSGNQALHTQMQREGIERLLAAWYYLEQRYKLREQVRKRKWDSVKAELLEYIDLGEHLYSMLADVHLSEYRRLRSGIGRALEYVYKEWRDPEIDTITWATMKKRQAQRKREQHHYRDAVKLLKSTIDDLEAERLELVSTSRDSKAGEREKEVAAMLAECNGSLGGIHRFSKEFRDAIRAYDKGYHYESNTRYGIVNSYNLTQRLITRVLLRPERYAKQRWKVEQAIFPEALQLAEAEVLGQLNGRREGDPWAMADLAMLRLLLASPEESAAWEDLSASKPYYFVLQSTLELLKGLSTEISRVASNSPANKKIAALMQRLRNATILMKTACDSAQ
jgi:hypothetical protein